MLTCAVRAVAVTVVVVYFQLQLPYLQDGDRVVVQSNAIMRYIARKRNLCKWTVSFSRLFNELNEIVLVG